MIDIKVVIPAAGKGSRSGLAIPKSLQKVGGIPIIIRICEQVKKYDENPIVIINPIDEAIFRSTFSEYNIKPIFCYQHEALGMGHALLQIKEDVSNVKDILLIWSDIPLIQKRTIDDLINCHLVNKNTFSLASFIGENPYTIVDRDTNGNVIAVLETHKSSNGVEKYGERDTGLFIFNAAEILYLLELQFLDFDVSLKIEFGFLSLIKSLVENKHKVQAYPISDRKDILSFNTPEDLQKILEQLSN